MRQGSTFGRLRGEDGRSLARALIVLILVSLFAGGLNAGDAAASGRTVICAAGDHGDAGVPDADRHHLLADCCLAGVTPLGMGLGTHAPAFAAPDAGTAAAPSPVPAADASATVTGVPFARGPPRAA